MRPLKVAVTAVSSALVLTGCGIPNSLIFTTDSGCGEIQVLSPTPDLILSPSGDATRFTSEISWRVNDVPAGKASYSATTTTFPIDWIMKAELAAEQVDPEFPLDPEDVAGLDFVVSLEGRFGETITPNADGDNIAIHDSGAIFAQEGAPDILDIFSLAESEFAPIVTALHLPVEIVSVCDVEPKNVDLTQLPPLLEEGTPFGKLEGASRAQVFPGYVPELIDFENTPERITFGNSLGDGRIPILASVTPWFTEFSLEVFSGEAELQAPSAFEEFWITQILWLQFGFIEDAVLESWYLNESDQSTFSVDLESALSEENYKQFFVDLQNQERNPDDPEVTIENLGIGDLEYLFVYVLYYEQVAEDEVKLSYSFEKYYPGVQGDLVTLEVFEEQQAQIASAPPAPYVGPVVSSVTPSLAAPGEQVVLSGENLEGVTEVSIDGTSANISDVDDGQLTITIPENTSPGIKSLQINSAQGQLMVQDMLTVKEPNATSVTASIKRQGDRVRIFAQDLIGAGKVQFFVNGREIAWVKAADGSDRKLRAHPQGGHYLVRSRELAQGKNIIEVYVDGQRVRRVAYTQ